MTALPGQRNYQETSRVHNPWPIRIPRVANIGENLGGQQ